MAEGLARFPQDDDARRPARRARRLGLPLEEGLALEARAGPAVYAAALRGAARFAGGEGRGAAGTGV